MSWLQLGSPDMEKLIPAEICSRRLSQREATSPDQTAALSRWIPPNAERVRMNGRTSGLSATWWS